MSVERNCGNRDFSKYDTMPTEELERFLRDDATAPEGQELDTEEVFYILEVITKRNKPQTQNTAQKAYESFLKDYIPELPQKQASRSGKHGAKWFRRLTTAAAVIAILILGTTTVNALYPNFWQIVANWTKDTFHLSKQEHITPAPSREGVLEYASLHEALHKDNIEIPLAPTWIPEGFQLTSINIEETPAQTVYFAHYTSGKKVLLISIRNHLNSDIQFNEQGAQYFDTYDVAGTRYYIFSNMGKNSAVWMVNSFECCIRGDISIDEIRTIIDSISKG